MHKKAVIHCKAQFIDLNTLKYKNTLIYIYTVSTFKSIKAMLQIYT